MGFVDGSFPCSIAIDPPTNVDPAQPSFTLFQWQKHDQFVMNILISFFTEEVIPIIIGRKQLVKYGQFLSQH